MKRHGLTFRVPPMAEQAARMLHGASLRKGRGARLSPQTSLSEMKSTERKK